MLSNFLVTQSGGTDTVTTTMILDGTIANADVASDAAIDVSKISLDDAVVFNDSGADKDFRVESDGKTHMLFVDGGNNRVGIGTDSPSQTFEVFNNTADATITKFSGADGNMSYVGGARLEFSRDGGCYIAAPGGASASMIFQAGDGLHTRMKLGNDGRVIIGDGGAEDTAVVFDGNAQDFYVGLDDSADDLVIGLGSTVGTTPAISINEDQDVTIADGAIDFDVASHDGTNGLKLGGTLVTSSAAELNLLDGKGIADEDDMSSDSASNLSTQQSIKAYVDASAGLADNAVTLAKLEDGTQGDILYYGASGAPARLGFGTSGYFLKTQGTGANPVWAESGSTTINTNADNRVITGSDTADTLNGESGLTYSASVLTVTGNILPEADGTRDLGASGTTWANVYSADLHLDNTGHVGNDVDGSVGSWTIQEGSDDLFLLNRKNGKKYKFNLQEV